MEIAAWSRSMRRHTSLFAVMLGYTLVRKAHRRLPKLQLLLSQWKIEVQMVSGGECREFYNQAEDLGRHVGNTLGRVT